MVRGAEPLLISVAHLIHELLRYEWFLWGTPLHTANRTASTLADELTASEVDQEAPGVARASRPTSVLISDRLRVNKYGVAVPV